MTSADPRAVVHLDLQTPNLARACAFYAQLFGWRPEHVHVGAGRYMALHLGGAMTGGVTESGHERPFWLPYVEVPSVTEAAVHAEALGAEVALEPREGPAGWRSIVVSPAGGAVALWQRKRGYGASKP